MALKVAVSPFFGGENWTDTLTGITFEKSKIETLAIYDISNIDSDKLDNIRKAVRLNALILVEGAFDEQEVKEVAPQAEVVVPKEDTPAEDVVPAEEVEVKKTVKKKA